MGNAQRKEQQNYLDLLVDCCERGMEDDALDVLKKIKYKKVLDIQLYRTEKKRIIGDKIVLLAVRRRMPKLVKELIDKGADTNPHLVHYNEKGYRIGKGERTLLYFLSIQRMEDIAFDLLCKGVFKKVKDKRKLPIIRKMCRLKQLNLLREVLRDPKYIPGYMIPEIVVYMYKYDLDDLVLETFIHVYLKKVSHAGILNILNFVCIHNHEEMLQRILELDGIDKIVEKIEDVDTFIYVNERYKKRSIGYNQL